MLDSAYVPVWVALAVGLPGIVSAVLGFIAASRSVRQHVETQKKLESIENSTNGALSSVKEKLQLVTEAADLAKSVLAERERRDREMDRE